MSIKLNCLRKCPKINRPFKLIISVSQAIEEAVSLLTVCDTPRLDAELLLGFCLGKNRTWLKTWPEQCLAHHQLSYYQTLVSQRASGMPLAYITGCKEFWSRSFTVGQGVLIPRPETETLIEQALNLIKSEMNASILDLGTGSGIIAITLAAERPASQILAIDRSQAALEIARLNSHQHGTTNVTFQQSHWFDSVFPKKTFDLIVSNPPYLAAGDSHLFGDGIRYEPSEALVAGPDGLDDILSIAHGALPYLRPSGFLLLEHGYNQAVAVAQVLAKFGYCDIQHFPDLSGHLRVTQARQAGFL
ncbi:MAG: peptide chain release factor N(5)-glutamine methyltransferase [Methylococcaceae bacterium]